MALIKKLEKIFRDLNLYEYDISRVDESLKKVEFFLIIDYSQEFLDAENYEFEKYLKERCFFYYEKAMHTRLSLAPMVRVEYSNFEEEEMEFFVSFPNEQIDSKTLEDLKVGFIDLTGAFVDRVLREELQLKQR